MVAFRFFGLIDEKDEPTKDLVNLVEHPQLRVQGVERMMRLSYPRIFDEHDLTKTTPKMLEDAMSLYGVQGDTRRKAVAFFLRAAKYAELPMHPLLSAQTRNSNAGVRRKRKALEGAAAPTPAGPQIPNAGTGDGKTKTITLPSGTVVTLTIVADWLDMKEPERDYIFGLIDSLQQVPSAEDSDEEEEVEE